MKRSIPPWASPTAARTRCPTAMASDAQAAALVLALDWTPATPGATLCFEQRLLTSATAVPAALTHAGCPTTRGPRPGGWWLPPRRAGQRGGARRERRG
jgi:hypothetical protein